MEASRLAEDQWFWRYKVLKMYRILYFRCAETHIYSSGYLAPPAKIAILAEFSQ